MNPSEPFIRRPVATTLLTLYTTPVVYLYLDRFRLWAQRSRRRGGVAQPVEAGAD